MRVVALIPARAGSKRIPGKNTKLLAGHPLIAYTIAAAQESGIFDRVLVSTDSREIVGLCDRWDVDVHIRGGVSDDSEADITWVHACLSQSFGQATRPDAFAILRPTSPFRTAETISRAWREFSVSDGTHDSLRAVTKATENPYKMWTWQGAGYPMKPLLTGTTADGVPLHSAPSQAAPPVYLQTSSLEIAYTSTVECHGSIAGRKVIPFVVEGPDALSLDTPDDWDRAEALAAASPALLPHIRLAPVPPVAPAA